MNQSERMMTIQESIKICLRKYVDFSGRATRAEFWWWVLATTIAGIVLGAVELDRHPHWRHWRLSLQPFRHHILPGRSAASPGGYRTPAARHRQNRLVAVGLGCSK